MQMQSYIRNHLESMADAELHKELPESEPDAELHKEPPGDEARCRVTLGATWSRS